MGGILVIIFYGLFWWFCSWVSKRIVKEQAPKSETKRRRWFWGLAATPLYIFIYEYTRYEIACFQSETFYPAYKIEYPGVLIFGDSGSAKMHSESHAGYVITHDGYSRWKVKNGKPTSKEIVIKQKFIVYHEGKKAALLTEQERKSLMNNAKYGVFISYEDVTSTIGKSSRFIYDFESGRKISNIDSVSKGLSQSNIIRSYLLPYRFDHCNTWNSKNNLLSSTFKNLEGKNNAR